MAHSATTPLPELRTMMQPVFLARRSDTTLEARPCPLQQPKCGERAGGGLGGVPLMTSFATARSALDPLCIDHPGTRAAAEGSTT